jgi:hypothetical protein
MRDQKINFLPTDEADIKLEELLEWASKNDIQYTKAKTGLKQKWIVACWSNEKTIKLLGKGRTLKKALWEAWKKSH